MNKQVFFKILFLTLFCGWSSNINTQNKEEKSVLVQQQKANNYLNLLQGYYSNGDYKMHKVYSDSLLFLAENYNMPKIHILALTNQAVFYKNRGERLEAINLYHKALEKCKEIPDDFRAKIIVLVNMGNIYNDIGSYHKAITYLEEVLVLLDKHENSDKIRAAALIGLANNYIEFKDYQNTILYAQKAKTLGEKINNEEVIVSAINNLCDAYIGNKNYEKALELSAASTNIEMLNKPNIKRASFLLNKGIAYYSIGNLEDALINLEACQTLSSEKKILDTEMYAHEFLAKVYEAKKDYKTSVLEQKKYIDIRNLYLKDKQDASNADLNNDINKKSETLAESNEELEQTSKSKKILVAIGGFTILLLSVILYFFVKRKRKLDTEKEKLQTQHKELQKNYSNLQSESTNNNEVSSKNLKPYKNSSLTPEKRDTIKKQIIEFMTSKKPFLNSEMTQADLAQALNISSHHFSEVLYYNLDQNFYNFINTYRVLEAQNLMKNPKYDNEKVLSIAFDSGFKSKTTFNRIFKNHTGVTPTEYRKQVNSTML